MNQIHIEEDHLNVIRSILGGRNLDVYVFGSRAKGTAQKFSDLDLLIKSPISKDELIEIKDLLEESNLPYKVDIVVWNEISEDFQKHIQPDLVKLEKLKTS